MDGESCQSGKGEIRIKGVCGKNDVDGICFRDWDQGSGRLKETSAKRVQSIAGKKSAQSLISEQNRVSIVE